MPKTTITKYKAAAIQYAPTLFDKERNLLDLLAMTEEAARNGAKLIVLPEMATTGYCFFSRAEITPYVETIPGPTTEKFAEIAAKHNCYIAVGMAEVEPATGIYFNSMAFVGPNGLIGKYRKTHSYISENLWAKDGDLGIPVFETEIGVLGGLICMDATFPEVARILALKGADVLCFPTNWLHEKAPDQSWMTRAFENGVYVVASDRWGNERTVEFSGGSAIIDPDGSIQSYQDSGNGIVYGTIDLAKTRDRRSKMAERRHREYIGLVQNTYLFNPLDLFSLYGQKGLPAGKKSLISAIQFNPITGDAEANLLKIEQMFEQVPTKSELVVLPELAICGNTTSKAQAAKAAEVFPNSSTVQHLQQMARKHGVYLVTTLIEKEGRRLYNTAVLVNGKGLVGKYRKIHLNDADRAWATPGDLGFPIFDISIGRVGLLIGYDTFFPESARCLAVQGADLVCIPAAMEHPKPTAFGATSVPLPPPTFTSPDTVHWHLMRARCEENNTVVAFANQWGENCFGRSAIFDVRREGGARHEAVAEENSDQVVSLEMDTSQLQGTPFPTSMVRLKELVRMRLHYWYDPLVR